MSSHMTGSERVDQPTPQDGGAAAGLREEPRLYGLFPAQVRGVDASGAPFHVRTALDNFAAGEFSLALERRVEVGRQLLVVAEIHEATVALHGTVTRAGRQPGGGWLLVVSVTHHRFV